MGGGRERGPGTGKGDGQGHGVPRLRAKRKVRASGLTDSRGAEKEG